MDIEKIGKAVSEALALQGLADGLQKEVNELDEKVKKNQKMIDDLTPLIAVRDAADKNRQAKQKKLDEVKKELDSRLSAMKAEGVILPLGEKVFNQRSKL